MPRRVATTAPKPSVPSSTSSVPRSSFLTRHEKAPGVVTYNVPVAPILATVPPSAPVLLTPDPPHPYIPERPDLATSVQNFPSTVRIIVAIVLPSF